MLLSFCLIFYMDSFLNFNSLHTLFVLSDELLCYDAFLGQDSTIGWGKSQVCVCIYILYSTRFNEVLSRLQRASAAINHLIASVLCRCGSMTLAGESH